VRVHANPETRQQARDDIANFSTTTLRLALRHQGKKTGRPAVAQDNHGQWIARHGGVNAAPDRFHGAISVAQS
jgi:hypothetical protein